MNKNYLTYVLIIAVFLFSNFLVANNSGVSSEISPNNVTDANTNLALLDDASLSGSAPDGRGPLEAILYDPSINDYHIRTNWNEYGVDYAENLGTPDADNGFFWRVDWSTPKSINYITFGGSYPNQPQPDALWRISYLNNNVWITLEEGQGGWIDNAIYEWDGTTNLPIVADALRVQIYSDGTTDLASILVRGRGGLSNSIDDRATTTKATLIQYLGSSPSLSTPKTETQIANAMQIFPNPSTGNIVIKFTFFVGINDIEVYDISGRLVKFIQSDDLNIENQQINIEGLTDGIYHLNVNDALGFRHQEKLIIKR